MPHRRAQRPHHALKHMAIDMPSLLKQAAGLRPVSVRVMYGGCTQTASAGLMFNSRDIYVAESDVQKSVIYLCRSTEVHVPGLAIA